MMRHCETTEHGNYVGKMDAELSAHGEAVASQAASLLQNLAIHLVVTSRQSRATATAQLALLRQLFYFGGVLVERLAQERAKIDEGKDMERASGRRLGCIGGVCLWLCRVCHQVLREIPDSGVVLWSISKLTF